MKTAHAILALVVLTGCPQVKEIDDDSNGACVPAEVQQVFDTRCNTPGCHSGTVQASLDLTATNSPSIIGRTSTQNPSLPLVEIGNVPGSYLAIKILPDQTLMELGVTRQMLRMPNGVVIDAAVQADLAIVLAWIAGAEFSCGGGTGSEGATTMGDSTTGPTSKACGIEDLKPGSPTDLVDAGDGAMQIPTDIGEVLANNCGCHYVDMLVRTDVADYFEVQPLKIATWSQWQGTFMRGAETVATVDAVRERIMEPPVGAAMPPVGCEAEPGENIADADRMLLLDWIAAGAPDGASWGGGGSTSAGTTTSGGDSTTDGSSSSSG